MLFQSRVTSHRLLSFSAAALTLGLLAGCASAPFEKRLPDFQGVAHFFPTGEKPMLATQRVQGRLDFVENKGVLTVKGELIGLKPNSTLGFHVHEKGSCMQPDGSDAGPHFNPAGAPHGAFDSKEAHHAGDLPPLKVDATGKAVVNFSTSAISLDSKAANGVIGRAMVIHGQADDVTAQPAGNAGPRQACGIIRRT